MPSTLTQTAFSTSSNGYGTVNTPSVNPNHAHYSPSIGTCTTSKRRGLCSGPVGVCHVGRHVAGGVYDCVGGVLAGVNGGGTMTRTNVFRTEVYLPIPPCVNDPVTPVSYTTTDGSPLFATHTPLIPRTINCTTIAIHNPIHTLRTVCQDARDQCNTHIDPQGRFRFHRGANVFLLPQYVFVCDANATRCVVDRVIRFETLNTANDEWSRLRCEWGLEAHWPERLPHTNRSMSRQKRQPHPNPSQTLLQPRAGHSGHRRWRRWC